MPNRLAQTASLYLRKHADNPIDWWPWCDAALEKARQENKPIFLSIGYSSCHWCTVMEGEAFSDPAVADYMNAHFLPIKVDREERPDLDSIYMQALQMMTGQGGWPLNVFLAPEDLVPFYGGTYFPLEAKYGRPGFLQVLQTLRRFYDSDTEKVTAVKTEILNNLQQGTALPTLETFPPELVHQGMATSARLLMPSGYGTSFPMIPYAETALRGVRFTGTSEDSLDIEHLCHQRGLDLALGGIYDHVAGGFHRYTVDPSWTVPHFEKMLYDNGQIMEYLAHLWCSGQTEPAFQRAIEGTVHWLSREMTAPEGYFYAAQDADSFVTPEDPEPEEGAFYVWDYSELQQRLTVEELEALAQVFTLSEAGNFEGQNVLQRTQAGSLSEVVETALAKLFVGRYGAPPQEVKHFPPAPDSETAKTQDWPERIPAVTDTKMIVAWNSLMISGLAKAAVAMGKANYLAMAARAAQFILSHQWLNDRFARLNYGGQPAVAAQSEDYALFIKALLDLQQATLALPKAPTSYDWMQAAKDLQAEMDEHLWHETDGGYYNTVKDNSDHLLVRERSFQDNATPAANGVAAANLVRLFLLTEEMAYLDRAEATLRAFGKVMEQIPRACPSLFAGLDWFRHPTLVKTSAELVPTLMASYLPTTQFAIDSTLSADTVGMVCQGLTCREPSPSLEHLLKQITLSQSQTG